MSFLKLDEQGFESCDWRSKDRCAYQKKDTLPKAKSGFKGSVRPEIDTRIVSPSVREQVIADFGRARASH